MSQIQPRANRDTCPHNWGLILGFMTGTNAPEAALCCMLCDTFDGELWDGGLLRYLDNLDLGNGVIVNGTRHNASSWIVVPVDIYTRQSVRWDMQLGTAVPEMVSEITLRSWWTPPPELRAAQVIDSDDFYEDDESLEEIHAAWDAAEKHETVDPS